MLLWIVTWARGQLKLSWGFWVPEYSLTTKSSSFHKGTGDIEFLMSLGQRSFLCVILPLFLEYFKTFGSNWFRNTNILSILLGQTLELSICILIGSHTHTIILHDDWFKITMDWRLWLRHTNPSLCGPIHSNSLLKNYHTHSVTP